MFSKRSFFILIVLVTVLALLPTTALAGDTPPPDWGCSPGYWKNHIEDWSPVTTDTKYNALFGGYDFDPDITLLQALRLRGGRLLSIARHNAAEYLNTHAASANCDDESSVQRFQIRIRQNRNIGLRPR